MSGGQSGVDRAALDVALTVDFPCAGWAPGDRMAEDGIMSDRYPLASLPKRGYRRTRQNVVDSEGTAILYYETLKCGTRLTRNLCALLKRPYILIDARRASVDETVESAVKFVEENEIRTLNVVGPRASGRADGYRFALAVVEEVMRAFGDGMERNR